jgi:hypothetical protein
MSALPSCSTAFEAQMKWPTGTLASPVRGGALETALLRPGCSSWSGPRPVGPSVGAPTITPDELARMQRRTQEVRSGVAGDARLYLGPAASLIHSPHDPTLVMDEASFQEIARRFEITTGGRANLAQWIDIASQPPERFAVR